MYDRIREFCYPDSAYVDCTKWLPSLKTTSKIETLFSELPTLSQYNDGSNILQCEVSSSHRQNDRQVVHPQEGEPGRRSTTGSHGPSAAVSTIHQPRRGSTNATYLSKDPRYGPSQIDYVMVSCRWATSAHKCSVKWGVSCQRWGRGYDHGLVSCVWVCRAFSPHKRDKQIDYAPLMAKDGDELRQRFDARVKQHLTATHCD